MGTAAVMLGASLSLFAFVGTLVSFGAWPGLSSHENVDSLLVESVTTRASEPIRVGEPRPASRADDTRGAARPAGTLAAGASPAVPVARLPSGAAPAPAPAAPAPSSGGGSPSGGEPVAQVPTRPLERTTSEVDRTVETVTQQTGEIVNQVGQQVQEPLKTVGGPADGLVRP